MIADRPGARGSVADVSSDYPFIHVDPDRAVVSEFGGTIAHGFLLLSLLPGLLEEKTSLPEGAGGSE